MERAPPTGVLPLDPPPRRPTVAAFTGGPDAGFGIGLVFVLAAETAGSTYLLGGSAADAFAIGIVAFASAKGREHLVGFMYAAWGVGSLFTGLVLAAPSIDDPVMRLVQALTVMGAATGLLAVAPDVWWLSVQLLLAGTAMAPMFAVTYRLLGDVTPHSALTEAYAWLASGIFAGVALGSAAAGAVISEVSPQVAFVGAGAIVGVAALVVVCRHPALVPRGPEPSVTC